MKTRPTALAGILFGLLTLGAGSAQQLTKDDFVAVTREGVNEATFEQFLSKLPKVTLGHRTYYLLEGDLLLNAEQVRARLSEYKPASKPTNTTIELKVMMQNGAPVYWHRGHRTLTYAVDRRSFATTAQYRAVSANLASAARAWESVCPACDVHFVHKTGLDSAPVEGSVTFIARYLPNEKDFVAESFFPNDELWNRYLYVTPSYFTTNFDKIGILRHELGHVLGYRHEHIEGIPGCYTEDNDWKPLTPYDGTSVMHYFCGGHGTMTLALSASDIAGHVKLYGAP